MREWHNHLQGSREATQEVSRTWTQPSEGEGVGSFFLTLPVSARRSKATNLNMGDATMGQEYLA
jgi:hypothetical protein